MNFTQSNKYYWREERLQNIAELRTSNVDKKSAEGEQPVRLCNYVDVYKNDKVTMTLDFMEATASNAQIERFNLQVDDVVITKDSESPDDIGIPALIAETAPDLVCGYHLTILRPYKDKAVGSYLAYALCSRLSTYQFYLAANGVTRFGLTYQETKNIRITLPPLDEQRRIAAFLDWKTGQIDALIARKQALLEMLKEKRLAVITQAVSRGLDPSLPLRDSGIPWLGKVPEHWEVRRLKFAVTCNDESLSETTEADYEIAYVDISSVNLVEGVTTIEALLFEDAPSRARRIVRAGDTIISTVRTYLKAITAIKKPTNNMIVSTGFAVVRPQGFINSDFLGYALQSTGFIGEVVANSMGVSYPAINPTALVCLPFCYPVDKKEQQQIVVYLDAEIRKLNTLEAKVLNAIERLQEYRTALITAATTGKIDVHNVKNPQPTLNPKTSST
jgi:Restriction endonuclease S subunits